MDWDQRASIKAKRQVDLILLLAEYGYPPVANDDAYKEILEQAENFKNIESKGRWSGPDTSHTEPT